MREAIQAPVSRETLREWLEDRYGVYMDVRHGNVSMGVKPCAGSGLILKSSTPSTATPILTSWAGT